VARNMTVVVGLAATIGAFAVLQRVLPFPGDWIGYAVTAVMALLVGVVGGLLDYLGSDLLGLYGVARQTAIGVVTAKYYTSSSVPTGTGVAVSPTIGQSSMVVTTTGNQRNSRSGFDCTRRARRRGYLSSRTTSMRSSAMPCQRRIEHRALRASALGRQDRSNNVVG